MITSRLISQIVIDSTAPAAEGKGSNIRVQVDHPGGPTIGTATIPNGTYWWGVDGGGDDFSAALDSALTVVYNNNWGVFIQGANQTEASTAEGRIGIEGDDDWHIYWDDALTTLDGLNGLTSVGGYLRIFYNGVLPDCEVCDLLDQLTSWPIGINVYDNLDDACTPVPAGCP